MLFELQLVMRLVLAAVLAAVMGLERQRWRQPAGLRTHMLVALGAAAFTMAGIYGVGGLGTVHDAGRVAAQVVTGIGFLGAGSIWHSQGSERMIRGLTTAASIWVAAAVGMLCGFGLFILAAGCALVAYVVLHIVRRLEGDRATVSGAVERASLSDPAR
jgi:putative Mg2+ transporter-C (MgtC) family protein